MKRYSKLLDLEDIGKLGAIKCDLLKGATGLRAALPVPLIWHRRIESWLKARVKRQARLLCLAASKLPVYENTCTTVTSTIIFSM